MKTIEDLSDENLKLYYELMCNCTERGIKSKINNLDLKFAYHIVRLLNEVEQILIEHDMDLERNREQLKAIRRGEWTLEEVEMYFAQKELALEKVYNESTLRYKADENQIKQLLMDCLEMHFGSLEKAIVIPSDYHKQLSQASDLIENVLRRM